jgi:alkylhydroperoxidase family enzyme
LWTRGDPLSLSQFLFALGRAISVGEMVEKDMTDVQEPTPDERFPSPVEGAPYLAPIENPSALMMKMVYYLSRRQVGDKFTPIKVFAARLPSAFGQFLGKNYGLDKKLTLPRETVMLIRGRVAAINVCPYCVDTNRFYAIKASMNLAKFNELEDYKTSPLFSEAERAALDYVTELTEEKNVKPNTFVRLRRSYSERAVCEIVWLAASEHLSNLINIGLNIHSDDLCQLVRTK